MQGDPPVKAAAAAALAVLFFAVSLAPGASAEDAAISATVEIKQSALTATLYNAQTDVRVSLAGTIHINTDQLHKVQLTLTIEATTWAHDINPPIVSRTTDGDVGFTAWVDVPKDAAEGSYALQVRGQDGDPFPIDAHAPFTISVFRGPLALDAQLSTELPHPGETASWQLTIRNLGSTEYAFDAIFSTPRGWTARTQFPAVQRVAPGLTAEVRLELTVPTTAPAGDYEWSVAVLPTSGSGPSASLSAPFEVIRPAPPPGQAQADLLALYWLPLTLGALGVGIALYFSLTEVGYLALAFSVLVPLFTRLKRDKVLDNFTRGQIYGYIQANPGAHYSAIQQVLDIENGVLAYHLRVLLRENYLVARSEGIFKRFYPRDYKIPKGRTLLTRLQVDMLEEVERNSGTTQRDLARSLGESKQVISYNVGVLRDAGLLEAERRGRDVILRATAPGSGDLIPSDAGSDARAPDTTPH